MALPNDFRMSFATVEDAVRQVEVDLREMRHVRPWMDWLDAAFQVAQRDPRWGIGTAWTQLVDACKEQGIR